MPLADTRLAGQHCNWSAVVWRTSICLSGGLADQSSPPSARADADWIASTAPCGVLSRSLGSSSPLQTGGAAPASPSPETTSMARTRSLPAARRRARGRPSCATKCADWVPSSAGAACRAYGNAIPVGSCEATAKPGRCRLPLAVSLANCKTPVRRNCRPQWKVTHLVRICIVHSEK